MASASMAPAPRRAIPVRVALATVLTLAVTSWPGVAPAEPTGEGEREGPAAAPVASAPALPAHFRSVQTGWVVDAEYNGTRLTDTVVVGVGAATLGLDARLDGPWLVRWVLTGSARAGAATLAPFAWLVGARAGASGELGHRLLLQRWSPYVMVGGRAAGDVTSRWLIVSETGKEGNGDGGTVQQWFSALAVQPRFGLGVAYQDARHSLRAVAFAEEQWTFTNFIGSARATAFGLSLGYDVADSWSILAEARVATRPPDNTPGLALGDVRTTRAVRLSARKVFRAGNWVELDLALSKDFDQLRFGSGLEIDTSNPGAFILAVSYGFLVW